MQRWTTTVGQHLFEARNECNETVPSVLAPAYYDVAEAATDCSEVEDGVFEVDEHPHPEHLQGIEWIYESPCLQSIAHIQFSPCTVISNHALADKICEQIQNTFAQVMPEHFYAQVIEFRNQWKVEQQKLWDPVFHKTNSIFVSNRTFPLPITSGQQSEILN